MADIILFTVIGLFVVYGFKKGFVNSAVEMVSLVAAAVLAWLLYPVISDMLISFGVDLSLADKIGESLNMYMSGDEAVILPQGIQSVIDEGRTEAINSAAHGIADTVLKVVTFAAVLIIARLIIWAGATMLNLVVSIPGISFVNRSAGMLVGAIQGIAVMYIALSVVYAASPINGVYEINKMISQSTIAKIMYENNPIVDFVLAMK